MSNNLLFPNTGCGITWGPSNNSQIYNDGNMQISTDDYLYIYAPTQFVVTSPNCSFSGNVYIGSNLLAT